MGHLTAGAIMRAAMVGVVGVVLALLVGRWTMLIVFPLGVVFIAAALKTEGHGRVRTRDGGER